MIQIIKIEISIFLIPIIINYKKMRKNKYYTFKYYVFFNLRKLKGTLIKEIKRIKIFLNHYNY